MKEFDEFAGKRMPYKESEEYVARLMESCAKRAIEAGEVKRKRGSVVRWTLEAVSVAAVLLLGVVLFVELNKESDYDKIRNSMTLSEVLSSMSEEELMSVNTYVVDEIPEYE